MEPLGTDQPLAPGQKKAARDIDAVMLAGCGVFLVVSVAVYGLAVWPHLVWPATERATNLTKCLLTGFIPALAVGIIGCRRGGVAGACGLVGGAMTVSVFLFLRLQQLFSTTGSSVGHDPEYPEWMMYAVPAGWFALALIIALLATPRPKFRGLGAEDPNK